MKFVINITSQGTFAEFPIQMMERVEKLKEKDEETKTKRIVFLAKKGVSKFVFVCHHGGIEFY